MRQLLTLLTIGHFLCDELRINIRQRFAALVVAKAKISNAVVMRKSLHQYGKWIKLRLTSLDYHKHSHYAHNNPSCIQNFLHMQKVTYSE